MSSRIRFQMKPQKVKQNFFSKLLKCSSKPKNEPKFSGVVSPAAVWPNPVEMSMSTKYCCMLMRLSIDCKGCYKKLRRILISIKDVETHVIERQYNRVSVCGRFRPSDVAIKIRRKMNRRVEIMEIQEFDEGGGGPYEQQPADYHPPMADGQPPMADGRPPMANGHAPMANGHAHAHVT